MNVSPINGVKVTNANLQKAKKKKSKLIKNEVSQQKDISNVCYKPLTFGRKIAEHKSWGAVVDPLTKETTFKILTYPDTRKVTVTVQKKDDESAIKEYELVNHGNGIFVTPNPISADEISHGDKYFYTIYKGNGHIDKVKDPYSFRQEELLGSSTIYDHSLYQWKDANWFSSNKNRISRLANKQNGLNSVKDAKIYEFNTSTLTKEGTFESAKKEIDRIKEQGFNAIEIMPVENTYSFNWGYDGVDKFAPSEFLGGADKLKELIDYSHSKGINVIMDIVPNHLGPDGAQLEKVGPYILQNNCFGSAFNYEGNNSKYVRDFIINSALNWLDNYHCDGLRLDMTKMMESDITMKQLAAEINYHKPDAFLIAEDSRTGISKDKNNNFYVNKSEPHDKRVTSALYPHESGQGETEDVHCSAIEKIESAVGKVNNHYLENLGYDSEWDFNFYHTLKECLYGNINLNNLEKAYYCAQDRVKYVMSHDEIGNFEGTRLIPKLMYSKLNLSKNITLTSDDYMRIEEYKTLKGCSYEQSTEMIKVQKGQFVAEKLATMLQTGMFDGYSDETLKSQILIPIGIAPNSNLTYNDIKNAYDESYNQNKLAQAVTYTVPGPVMVFQGDEKADLTPFRFFRQFESAPTEPLLHIEKGYDTGKAGLLESKLGNIPYSKLGQAYVNGFENLTKDLNYISDKNPALTKGYLIIGNTVKHPDSQLIATHAFDNESSNEIFTITNFKNVSYSNNESGDYCIKFPKGVWSQILSTDDKKYNGSGNYTNEKVVLSNGEDLHAIKLAAQSTYIFKRVD